MFRPAVLAALFCLTPLVSALAVPLEPVEVVESSVKQDFRAEWANHLRQQRASNLARLQVYVAEGRFPQSPDAVGHFHRFLDEAGTPCAVADLIWNSGHEALVRHTAVTDNEIELSSVQDGPLMEWMLTSGFTQEEIAMIQRPGFGRRSPPVAPAPVAQAKPDMRASFITHLIPVLSINEEVSIDKALGRLGDRIQGPPPVLPAVL